MTLSLPRAGPIYLDAAPDVVFGTFHAAPNGAPARSAVLICPPWGWDEVTSYRSRKAWAELLAENGHPTLRIDFPAAGDSAGSPGDPARIEAWKAGVIAATTWLVGSSGSGRVAVIGLGLGGLIAGMALADGAPIDDLVLWAAPARGRTILREQRAFGKLQSSRYGPTGDAEEALPDGWLEIGGFVQSAETVAAIERLELSEVAPGRVQRALLLGRDGMPVEAGLRKHLEEAGVEVTVAPGNGWAAMCFHPERYQPPLEVLARVTGWLGAAPGPAAAPVAPPDVRPFAADHIDLDIGSSRIRETPIHDDESLGGAFGVLAEPVDAARTDLCAIFLNAGAVRRIGPNRMWVEAGRRWAARGVPAFRVDVEGIGDANGDAGMYSDVRRFYTPDRRGQVTAIIDALEARGLGRRFVLIGLCAGAYSAFTTAALDERVVAALVINPRVLVWDPAILERRDAHLVTRVLEPSAWWRILRGETTAATVLGIGQALTAEMSRAVVLSSSHLRARRRLDRWTDELGRMLDQLREKTTRVVLAFSGDEPVYDELEAEGFLDRIDRWPNVVLRDLPGSDHTLRPIRAQRALHEILDGELDLLVGVLQVDLRMEATDAGGAA